MDYQTVDEAIGRARRASLAATSSVSVPTPSRDLSLRRGAYTKNVQRLEQSVEEMSAGGSDIGEEIRRMNEAERRSRQNSIQSSPTRTAPLDIVTKGRKNSYANSIVDLNSNARAGGFSPGAYLTSPTDSSFKIGSWTRTSMHRQTSTDSSRLAYMTDINFEDGQLQLELDTHGFGSPPSRQLSQASHAAGDDGATQRTSTQLRIRESTTTSAPTAVVVSHADVTNNEQQQQQHHHHQEDQDEEEQRHHHQEEQDEERQDQVQQDTTVTLPVRSRSTDTFQQAQTAFMDFDGVHCSPELEEYIQLDQDGNEIRRISGRTSSVTTSLRAPSILLAPNPTQKPLGAPPPEEGMVFYPAPVPRMLNLPKRLSQLPAAGVQAKRRTQALSQMYAPNRNSAAWLSQGLETTEVNRRSQALENPRGQLNERLSVVNFSNVPPQLRASVFFEHQTVVQEVDVKSDSAVATLDSILAASATAPVSAFTDHPYAGDISKTVYAAERANRRSTTGTTKDLRMSSAIPLPNRKSNLSSMLKRASSAQHDSTYTMLEPQATDAKRSHTSVGDLDGRTPLSGDIAEESEEDEDVEEARARTELQLNGIAVDDEELEHEHGHGHEHELELEYYDPEDFEDDEDVDPDFAQPTTLLAELQVRKAQLKSRNRTAATAFPNGMHSTLLQLDAVAAINKKKRSNQRVALAWEDPNLKEEEIVHDVEDEDVPLGMLFPSKNGLLHRKMGDDADWDRPLGLMEKREMEDNEPLSSRRSRLRGEPIYRPRPQQRVVPSQPEEIKAQDADTVNDETEKQRQRRISTKDALDDAIADIVPKDGSRPLSTFTDDLFSQLNIGEGKKEQAATPVDIEDETLGQRRARLQREKEAAGSTSRPELQNRNSMSTLLNANPIGERKTPRERTSTQGTLLFASERAQAEHKRSMLASNMRSTSYGGQRPLAPSQSTASLIQPAYGAAYGIPTSTSNAMLGMQNAGYFAQQPAAAYGTQSAGYGVQSGGYSAQQATAGYGVQNAGYYMQMPMAGYSMQNAGYLAQQSTAAMVNPQAHGMLTGQPLVYPAHAGIQGQGLTYPGMTYGYGATQPTTVQQRSAIDQWRSNIA